MVEGPGCKVKGEIMSKRILGKTVVSAKLPVKNEKVKKENDVHLPEIYGRKVSEVRTLGKELFIFFVETSVCVRIHFLMDGSIRYGDKTDKKESSEPSLIIFFSDDKLTAFKSSVHLRPAEDSRQHCNSLADLDICSSIFNLKRAQQRVEEKQLELICDVIMDQTILPGVGNIIKNEGLFKSGIKPTTCVSDLSLELITCLLHRLRDFSHVFYLCRKNNKPLKNHLCIYEKSKCPQCGTQITVCKPGSLSRLTFFCDVCQVNTSSSTILSLPKKNSLLGFLQISNNSTEDMWACTRCTFINSLPSISCSMCLCPKADKCESKLKRKVPNNSEAGTATKRSRPIEFTSNSASSSSNEIPTQQDNTLKDLNFTPVCSMHQKKCSYKTVTRHGENRGRPFYSCSIRGDKGCRFFQWADLHYPLCKHEKRTILRRVLKLNDNNGKEFYCCPLSKDKQCGFFQWA